MKSAKSNDHSHYSFHRRGQGCRLLFQKIMDLIGVIYSFPQVWSALLAYLLIRYAGYLGKWKGSFRRLFTLLRGVLFSRLNLASIVESCGTARGSPRMIATPQQAYLPGMQQFIKRC